jgi:hypothetical protein
MQSILGGSRAGLRAYEEAEPLLAAGYEGLKAREQSIPLQARGRVGEAFEGILLLYEGWGMSEKLATWWERHAAPK